MRSVQFPECIFINLGSYIKILTKYDDEYIIPNTSISYIRAINNSIKDKKSEIHVKLLCGSILKIEVSDYDNLGPIENLFN